MPFDRISFDGGLQQRGIKKCCVRGVQRYTISCYKDLNDLLGADWHVRGINVNGDFCYVILQTIEFYLYHRRPIKEYVPKNGQTLEITRELGYGLTFSLIRGDGTPNKFGTDTTIFCNCNP